MSPAWSQAFVLVFDPYNIWVMFAASLFGLDPDATRCALASDPLADAKPHADAARQEGALPSPWTPRGPTTRRELLRTLTNAATPWSPD